MSVIAIVGAGPGLGRAIAERFAREGFDVALLSRSQQRLVAVRDDIRALGLGVAVEAFAADVTDPVALNAALTEVRDRLGAVDVLEYSPAPSGAVTMVDAVDLTIDTAAREVELYLYGGITAVQSVLPTMRKKGTGTVLVSTGASSGPVVFPPLANVAAGSAGLRNWTLNLHDALRETGVFVAHVALAVTIGDGRPGTAPHEIAEHYWHLHTMRDRSELVYFGPTSTPLETSTLEARDGGPR